MFALYDNEFKAKKCENWLMCLNGEKQSPMSSLSQVYGKGIKPCILVSILTKRFEPIGSLRVISYMQGRREQTSNHVSVMWASMTRGRPGCQQRWSCGIFHCHIRLIWGLNEMICHVYVMCWRTEVSDVVLSGFSSSGTLSYQSCGSVIYYFCCWGWFFIVLPVYKKLYKSRNRLENRTQEGFSGHFYATGLIADLDKSISLHLWCHLLLFFC